MRFLSENKERSFSILVLNEKTRPDDGSDIRRSGV